MIEVDIYKIPGYTLIINVERTACKQNSSRPIDPDKKIQIIENQHHHHHCIKLKNLASVCYFSGIITFIFGRRLKH